MGALNNFKDIRDIYIGDSKIKAVYKGKQLIYKSDNINPSYNYFVFNINSQQQGDTVLELKEDRRGDTTSWDGLTDWGDGTIDSKLSHTYENNGTYTVKTKWMYSTYIEHRHKLVGCDNINKNITDVVGLFSNCKYLKYVDMSRFGTRHITDMNHMFYNCYRLETLNMKGWDTSNVVDMSYMFYNCEMLTPRVSHFNVSNVKEFHSTFYNCRAIDGSEFKYWRTSSAESFACMFQYARVIENELNLSFWGVSGVRTFYNTFFGCQSYDGYNVRSWSVSSSDYVSGMFVSASCRTCVNPDHHVKHGFSDELWKKMKS
jgi:surface protein